MNLNVTPVFHRNWEAIHAVDENGERKYRYIINEGSSRSSKTFSEIDVYDIYARRNKNKRLTCWRDTKTDCVKTLLADMIRHLSATEVDLAGELVKIEPRWLKGFTFQETKSILRYVTGSTIEIHGTDDEETVHGLNQSCALISEPYKISRAVFDQIDQRTEDFILIDWNPTKAHWIEDLKKDKRAILIHSTFLDNIFCPKEQKNKILSYQPVSMCEVVEQKLLTEAAANSYDFTKNKLKLTANQIKELSRCIENERKRSASSYNWSVYGLGLKAERPNRIFHFEEIPLQEYLQLDVEEYFYSDWGAVDPWAIGGVKYYDGALYVKELNYLSENDIRAKLQPTELQLISSSDEGIVTWMFGKLSIPKDRYIICDKNRATKILALREGGYDYALAAPKPPGSIIDGIDLLNNMKVFYTSDSVNIKYEQENYSRKVDRYGVVLEDPEDLDNHHLDGIRDVALHLRNEGFIRKI